MGRYDDSYGWKPYVPVAERRRQAARKIARLAKKGKTVSPVVIEGRTIAKTFWGKSWCDNLERYSDYANRLPRGRTYARNGSLVDLQLAPGTVTALVSGSSLYRGLRGLRGGDRFGGRTAARAVLASSHDTTLPGEDRTISAAGRDRI